MKLGALSKLLGIADLERYFGQEVEAFSTAKGGQPGRTEQS
jgi:hypothetical protein